MELLVVTSRWPRSQTHEFLDDEISALAEVFDKIVVAPMRPDSAHSVPLPDGVVCDSSLARHLVGSNRLGGRRLTAAARAVKPNPAGFGVAARDFVGIANHRHFVREAVRLRADTRSVAEWAGHRPAPDVAYTFWLGSGAVGLRSAWPAVPVVSRVHGGDLYSERVGWKSLPFQVDALDSVDLAAPVSEHGAQYLRAKYPRQAAKIRVSRLGIEDLGLALGPVRSSVLRLLSVSTVDQNKRVGLIGEVAVRIAQRSPEDVHWTHIGDGPEMPRLRRLAEDAPTNLTVDLRGQRPVSYVHHQLISGRYDVMVNLSLSEGAPVSLMEAQCAGLPVVATSVGGTPEVVPRGLNELVGVGDSVQAVANAVIHAAGRPLAERAARRAHWSRKFSAARNYPLWADELAMMADT